MTVCTPSGYFFFNDTATTEIYTLSLHDALPISVAGLLLKSGRGGPQSRLDRPGAQHPDLSRHAASRDCAQQQTYRDLHFSSSGNRCKVPQPHAARAPESFTTFAHFGISRAM